MTLELGDTPPPFDLPATDGRRYSLSDVTGTHGTVVAFICNHCPYVLAVVDRIVSEAEALADEGIGFAAICANDARHYPEDSFERMMVFARQHEFGFPYLHDESQQVARAWDAACTPEFYGLDADGVLRYRGRLDSSGRMPAPGAERELYKAMLSIARTGEAPAEQHAAMGCSIKWKPTA